MKRSAGGLILFFAIAFAGTGLADDLRKAEQFSGTHLAFEFAAPYGNATLTVSGPNDFQARAASKTGAPSLDLQKFGTVADGSYTYQLTASSDRESAASPGLDNGRAGKAGVALPSVSTSGTFRVKDGVIVPRGPSNERSRRDQP
jgi:hypothetical protein